MAQTLIGGLSVLSQGKITLPEIGLQPTGNLAQGGIAGAEIEVGGIRDYLDILGERQLRQLLVLLGPAIQGLLFMSKIYMFDGK